jgi:hypothetical protein
MEATSSFDVFWENLRQAVVGGDLSLSSILRTGLVVFLIIYLFYAFLVMKQIGMMNRFLSTTLSPWTKILGLIYVLYTLFLLLAILIF